jgi:hypothetical protein
MELSAEPFAMVRILVPTLYGSSGFISAEIDDPKLISQRSKMIQDPSLIIGCLPSQKKADSSHVPRRPKLDAAFLVVSPHLF